MTFARLGVVHTSHSPSHRSPAETTLNINVCVLFFLLGGGTRWSVDGWSPTATISTSSWPRYHSSQIFHPSALAYQSSCWWHYTCTTPCATWVDWGRYASLFAPRVSATCLKWWVSTPASPSESTTIIIVAGSALSSSGCPSRYPYSGRPCHISATPRQGTRSHPLYSWW